MNEFIKNFDNFLLESFVVSKVDYSDFEFADKNWYKNITYTNKKEFLLQTVSPNTGNDIYEKARHFSIRGLGTVKIDSTDLIINFNKNDYYTIPLSQISQVRIKNDIDSTSWIFRGDGFNVLDICLQVFN